MENNNQKKLINDTLDLDTLLVVLLDRIDPLMKIFIFSLMVLIAFYIFDQRIYQSSTLIHFEQQKIVPGTSQLTPLTNSSTSLSGKKEIYKSFPTITGAREKMIQDNVLDEIPNVQEISDGLSFSRDSNLLTVRFKYKDKEDTKTILEYINKEFLIDSIENEQLKAKKGIEFINTEIPKITNLLSDAEQNLTEFRTSSGKYLIFEEENRDNVLESLENQIKNIEFKELELREFYKPTHPIYLTLIEQKNILKKELNDIELNIKDIPAEQRVLFNLQQKVNIYSSSLETLEKQKLNLNLTAASSLSNIRIVNSPSEANKISPKITIILIAFVILILFYLYFLIDHLITDRILSLDALLDFLEERNLFIGAFPLVEPNTEKKLEVLNYIEKNNLDRSAISLLEMKDKISIVASMKGGVGKTYFSIKMYEKLKSLGKNVCLVDMDLRKKGASFTYKESDNLFISYEDFLNNDDNYNSCVINRPITDDPVKFLSSSEIDTFIKKLRDNFDFVLIDTSPLGAFIDAKLLATKINSMVVILSSHFSTFGEILSLRKEITSKTDNEVELKYFLNKVKYFLEIFRFQIRYPLYGSYGYYDTYYLNNDASSVTIGSLWKLFKKYLSNLYKKFVDLEKKK